MEALESVAIRLYAAAFGLPEDVVAFALAGADKQTGGELGALTRAKFRASQGPDKPRVSTGVMAIDEESHPDLENPKAALMKSQRQAEEMLGSGANDPIEASPAVRAAKASTATNRGILPGGETVEDEEGWSYKRFEDGSIQIVTAPDSNKSAIGMMLTDKSTGDNAEYYKAISGFMKRKLDSPMSDLEATAMPEEGTMAGIDAAAKVEAEAPVEVDAPEMSDMSAADARKASRRMRMNQGQQKARDRVSAKQDERRKKAKEIAGRFLKNRRGLLKEEGEDGQTETVGD